MYPFLQVQPYEVSDEPLVLVTTVLSYPVEQ